MAPGASMDLFRSEEMQLVQMIIPSESAHSTVSALGELGLLQFKDLNRDKSPVQRTYATQVKRCGEMARKLRFFREQMLKAGIAPPTRGAEDLGSITFDDLEVSLSELESELSEISSNSEKLLKSRNELAEFQLVLEKAGEFFSSAQANAAAEYSQRDIGSSSSESLEQPLLLEQELQIDPTKQQLRLGFITGLVAKAKARSFERILFRATRGNMFLKQAELDAPVLDPASGEQVEKVVFVVFFAGDRARTKVSKICEAFGANRYPFPDDSVKRRQMRSEVRGRLSELQATVDASTRLRDNLLSSVAARYASWSKKVQHEKAVYHILNQLNIDVTRQCLVAEAWCPVSAKREVQEALDRGSASSNAFMGTIFQTIGTREAPPTFFRTNKFSSAFQEIVDAYGMATYQEANPGVFSIITFPFLFAVMFGDWGHGICMLLAALWLISNETKFLSQKLDDIMDMLFGGRYVILLMSLFSIYTGLVYNEFFALALPLFGRTAYSCREADCSTATTAGLIMTGPTYPFGVDPSWKGSRTELPFLNSLKMKMSILLGVSQMYLGLVLKYCNGTFFQKPLDIWYEFIPQVLFLGALFGYLSVLIVLKWASGSQADLYHVMIYMFLSPLDDLGDNQLFPGQREVQVVLLLVALVAVPWMLLPKPLILRAEHIEKMHGKAYDLLEPSTSDLELDIHGKGEHEGEGHHGHGDEDEEEFEFSEIMVHQMIHTIEFVLGAISNTASYLRLWALSLAHAELSTVFLEMVLLPALATGNFIFILIGGFIWLCATVGVLLVMESLSAFLHALRLHWVEFMNKFYVGEGYKFAPFAFTALPDEED